MKIEVCVGSSCHVKGGQNILNLLKKSIKENGLEDKVMLAGTTCLGQCKSSGVNMRIDGNVVTGVTEAGFNDFFKSSVLIPLGK
ncbi:MAG: (2Fe-2S) ferredoxin domain-containing protein [Treponema sp.]|nr:(2Fe-2S) ferredoxin domain-containing protein [Treponema sp.]